MTHAERDPVAVAEARRAAGTMTRQRLHQIRRAHDAPPARMGAPPKPAHERARNARGNVEVRVMLPQSTLATAATLWAPPPLVGRRAVLSYALPLGFAAMQRKPPRAHVAPAGERTATGAQGPIVEMPPSLLASIDAYAAEHGTARAVVVAMAVVRGVGEMRKGGGR